MEIKRTFDILPYALKNHPFDDCLAAKVNDDWKIWQESNSKLNRKYKSIVMKLKLR